MKTIKTLLATAVIAGSMLSLAACSANPGEDSSHPQGGYWTTTDIGDVWCVDSSSYSESRSCQWSTLTTKGSHKGAIHSDGSYHYLISESKKQERVFCLDYAIRNYMVMDCNWNSVSN